MNINEFLIKVVKGNLDKKQNKEILIILIFFDSEGRNNEKQKGILYIVVWGLAPPTAPLRPAPPHSLISGQPKTYFSFSSTYRLKEVIPIL